MPLSNRFIELRERVAELRRNMIPKKFSSIGDYTEREIDRAKGYKILVHAEMEAYLEDVCRNAVLEGVRNWKTRKRPSLLLIALLTSYHSSWNVHDERENSLIVEIAKSRRNIKDSTEKVVDLACTQFIQRVADNHGIKESNVKSLLFPVGIDISSIDTVWLADIDSFGTSRGDIAHKSKRTTSLVNPEDEYTKVKTLMEGLKRIDRAISSML